VGVVGRLYQVGFGDGCSRSVKDLTHMEKAGKWLISVVKIVSVKKIFKNFESALKNQKDVYYASITIPSIVNLSKLKDEYNKEGFIKTVPIVLYAVAAFFETGTFLKNYGDFKFERFTQLSKQLGAYEVRGYKPFSYRPMSILSDSPKSFLILASSSISLSIAGHEFLFPKGGTDAERKKNRLSDLSTDKLLGIAGHIGKILLITLGDTPYNKTTGFKLIDLGTNSASLISAIIKRHR
jgi:hypothetical protein